MPRITVVGSANVDLVVRVPHLPAPGESVIGSAFMQTLGGKGANQAVAAAKLGAQVIFVARVGDDSFGATCIESYQAAGVATHAIQRTPQTATGIAVIGVADDGENSIMVAPGANMTLTPADVEAAAQEIRTADVLLVQLEIPEETVRTAVEIAHAAGVKIVLNPAPFRPVPRSILEKVSVLTPNETEAAHLLGRQPAHDEDLAKEILGLGAQSAVITLGADGALVAGSWGYTRVPAFKVKPVDTTGAGDAFNAGLGVALAEGKALDQAVRFAAAAAAVAVTRVGAQPSMPTRADVEGLLR